MRGGVLFVFPPAALGGLFTMYNRQKSDSQNTLVAQDETGGDPIQRQARMLVGAKFVCNTIVR